MAPTFLKLSLGLSAVLAGIQTALAESHTISFINKCGKGTPTLIQDGQIVSTGQPWTTNKSVAGIAYLQTGECLFNGEHCTLMEYNLGNPTCPGCGSSVDISLIDPHAYNVETSFAYYNGGSCNGQGRDCNSPTCSTAFFKPEDWQVQVQCETDDVNLLIAFCADATTLTPGAAAANPPPPPPATSTPAPPPAQTPTPAPPAKETTPAPPPPPAQTTSPAAPPPAKETTPAPAPPAKETTPAPAPPAQSTPTPAAPAESATSVATPAPVNTEPATPVVPPVDPTPVNNDGSAPPPAETPAAPAETPAAPAETPAAPAETPAAPAAPAAPASGKTGKCSNKKKRNGLTKKSHKARSH